MSLIVSLFVVVATYGTCHGLKRLASAVSSSPSSFALSLFLDFITSVEFIVVAFELGIVMEHYGLAVWSICLYLSVTYQVIFWKEFGFPVPLDRIMEFVHGKVGAAEAVIRAATLLLTGLFAFRLIGFLWALEISTHHSGRYESLTTAACKVPFGVSPAVSLATEAAGSLALGLGIPLIADNPTLANNSPTAAVLAISGLVVAVVLCALPLSGGIFNPMLGLVLFGGCEGHTWTEHVAVYWAGATAGTLAAQLLYPAVRKAVYRPLEDTTKKSA